MSSDTTKHGFCIQPGEGQPLSILGRIKVSSADTGGRFEVFELAARQGPAPHVHHDRDECFCILNGHFTFILGEEEVEASTGAVVFVPLGTRHAFKPSEGARAVVFVSPAGLEGFFRELGEGLATHRSEADLRATLAGKYDSEPVA